MLIRNFHELFILFLEFHVRIIAWKFTRVHRMVQLASQHRSPTRQRQWDAALTCLFVMKNVECISMESLSLSATKDTQLASMKKIIFAFIKYIQTSNWEEKQICRKKQKSVLNEDFSQLFFHSISKSRYFKEIFSHFHFPLFSLFSQMLKKSYS